MRQTLAVILLLVLIGAVPPSARGDDIADCTQSRDIERRIRGCARLLEAGRLSRTERATAYTRRGLAYAKKGQHDRAIADYNKAIQINPRLAGTYNNRG